MSTFKLFVECDTDLFFIGTVISSMRIPKLPLKHAGNRGKVVNEVMKNSIAFGVIDEDPQSIGQPSFLNRFKEKASADGLRLLEYTPKKKILVIQPRIEDWFLKLASRYNISPGEFNLTNRAEDLHRMRIFRNKNYQEFVEALCTQCDEVKTVRLWIQNFVKANQS